jgi:phenylpropionate dioxygenase-like ring-hydroxylating dioxygenase large terminal subunit
VIPPETERAGRQNGSNQALPRGPLSREYYTSEGWYERDLERVFRQRWLFAGHASEVSDPGQFFTFELGTDSVIVSRANSGELKAFHNVCRHRGSRVCQESAGHVKGFRCPFHGWSYGLDGTLKVASKMPPEFDKSSFPLRPVWLEEWNGLCFISLADERPGSVSEALASADFSDYGLARTKVIADRVYHTAANWKLVAETFGECYHCAINHPGMCRVLDPFGDIEAWDDADAVNESPDDGDYVLYTPDVTPAMIHGAVTMSTDGQLVCQRRLGALDRPQSENAGVFWFPNFGMFAQPDYAITFSWLPTSPTTTIFRSTWSVHEDAVEGQDYDPENVAEFEHQINVEDTDLCGVVQLGVSSQAYDNSAPYHPVFEAPLRGYMRTYLEHVT